MSDTSIWLIQQLWVDPSENRNAKGYEPEGYCVGEDVAERLVADAGYLNTSYGYPIFENTPKRTKHLLSEIKLPSLIEDLKSITKEREPETSDTCMSEEKIPTPPATHILYTGPKRWQALPDGSLFWDSNKRIWGSHSQLLTVAIPEDETHYAIPINVTLPPGYTPPDTTPDVLEEARDLIRGDRAESYGEARASFQRIADFWSTYKGVQFTPKDVASMMILLKISRGVTSAKRDNWVDILGYGALGCELENKE